MKPYRQFHRALLLTTLVLSVYVLVGCGKELPSDRVESTMATEAPILATGQTQAHAGYAGSASCQSCHATAYQNWATSHHHFAERSWKAETDSVPFQSGNPIPHGTNKTTAQLLQGRPNLTDSGHGPAAIERVIGHDPLRQFLISSPQGRSQASELAWDPHRSNWFNIFGNENRVHGEWGHWTGRGMNWNSMCAYCHNTRLFKNYDPTTDAYQTTMAERSVGCESCHGPMKSHVDWRLSGGKSPGQDPAIARRLSKSQTLDTCGTCHSRRNELTGDFVPGHNFHNHFALVVPDETPVYYADGQVHEENYEFTSFLSSKMHQAGVTCMDCHEPHSAKVRTQGNDLCLRCHNGTFPKAPVIRAELHTFHASNNAGSLCVSCHMPTTTYMQRHPRHDHSFTTPDPLLTRELGIPNACNRCHANQTVDWAIQHSEQWYGAKLERGTRTRARLVAAARQGQSSASSALLEASDHEPSPVWRATFIRLIQPQAIPDLEQRIQKWSVDPDPLVRTAVARMIEEIPEFTPGQKILTTLQKDPVRSVRLAALWSDRAKVSTTHPGWKELEWHLQINSDQPAGQLNWGALQMAQGNSSKALEHYTRAVQWDPGSSAIRHDYAMVLSQAGMPERALEQLDQALRIEPQNADLHFKKALAENDLGKKAETLRSLEKTVLLDPKHARAWYNLGLLRHELKDSAGAIDALRKAEGLDPSNAQIPYARATIHAQLGQLPEAQAAAQRVLELQPGSQDALLLLQTMGR